jgi:hypothetical protein
MSLAQLCKKHGKAFLLKNKSGKKFCDKKLKKKKHKKTPNFASFQNEKKRGENNNLVLVNQWPML